MGEVQCSRHFSKRLAIKAEKNLPRFNVRNADSTDTAIHEILNCICQLLSIRIDGVVMSKYKFHPLQPFVGYCDTTPGNFVHPLPSVCIAVAPPSFFLIKLHFSVINQRLWVVVLRG